MSNTKCQKLFTGFEPVIIFNLKILASLNILMYLKHFLGSSIMLYLCYLLKLRKYFDEL